MKDFLSFLKEVSQNPNIGSAEVQKIGQVPQVGQYDIPQDGTILSTDTVNSIDSQVQFLKVLVQNATQQRKITDFEALEESLDKFINEWEAIKNRHITSNDTLDNDGLGNRFPTGQELAYKNQHQPPAQELPQNVGNSFGDYTNSI